MKVFTVTKTDGLHLEEFAAYVRLLRQWQIDITDMPRVLDRGALKRWLYAWDYEADAERFAQELNNDLRKQIRPRPSPWRVCAVEQDRPDRGPLGPLEIGGGIDSGGRTYRLTPIAEWVLELMAPQVQRVDSVSIGNDSNQPFDPQYQQVIWDKVAFLLTGLTEEQWHNLGGYRIVEPGSGEVWREAPAFVSAA
jgi:hypothetical protein